MPSINQSVTGIRRNIELIATYQSETQSQIGSLYQLKALMNLILNKIPYNKNNIYSQLDLQRKAYLDIEGEIIDILKKLLEVTNNPYQKKKLLFYLIEKIGEIQNELGLLYFELENTLDKEKKWRREVRNKYNNLVRQITDLNYFTNILFKKIQGQNNGQKMTHDLKRLFNIRYKKTVKTGGKKVKLEVSLDHNSIKPQDITNISSETKVDLINKNRIKEEKIKNMEKIDAFISNNFEEFFEKLSRAIYLTLIKVIKKNEKMFLLQDQLLNIKIFAEKSNTQGFYFNKSAPHIINIHINIVNKEMFRLILLLDYNKNVKKMFDGLLLNQLWLSQIEVMQHELIHSYAKSDREKSTRGEVFYEARKAYKKEPTYEQLLITEFRLHVRDEAITEFGQSKIGALNKSDIINVQEAVQQYFSLLKRVSLKIKNRTLIGKEGGNELDIFKEEKDQFYNIAESLMNIIFASNMNLPFLSFENEQEKEQVVKLYYQSKEQQITIIEKYQIPKQNSFQEIINKKIVVVILDCQQYQKEIVLFLNKLRQLNDLRKFFNLIRTSLKDIGITLKET